MSKINCEVIGDMLPIYVENMASSSTKKLVEEHLAFCESCRKKEAEMHRELILPNDVDTKPLRSINKILFQKKVTLVVLTVLSMLFLAVLSVIHINSPIVLPYEEIADSIEVHVADDNSVYITLHAPGVSAELQDGIDEYGRRVQYISFSTTEWNRRFATGDGLTLKIDDTADSADPENLIKRIYYYPSLKNHEAVCLYEAEDLKDVRNAGVSILPRLTLNYYTLFAVILVVAGGICCIIFRKSTRRFYICLKIALIPLSYFLCSQLILCNKDDIYNALYYFSGILMAAFVLYVIGYWVVDFVRISVKK